VAGIAAMDPRFVALQIRAVCRAFPVAAAKTGMLYSAAIIRAVAAAVAACRVPLLVVDPVMVATSGARLLRGDAVEALCAELLPRAALATPNIPEAEVLVGRPIRGAGDMEEAAAAIGGRFGCACLVKGGHGRERGGRVVDVLYAGGRVEKFESPRVCGVETHGTGCALSAAAAALLARGAGIGEAVRGARDFVFRALRRPLRAGRHTPLGIRPR
jgi:hydroxymethylpyrimidine kinase/phosphomethylpyrimidine kinase